MSRAIPKGLSIWRLGAINAVVAGLEIAACVAFTYIPPLLLKVGFSETQMSIILGVAPFLALFTVPVLGRWSDSCTSRFGRRRPFILGMSVVLIFSLLLLCVGQTIEVTSSSKPMRMLILSVGVIFLDYASQAAINPCEALVSDIMVGQVGEEVGFTVYSAMLSVGACIGYLVAALDWDTIGVKVGTKEQTAFLLVLFTFLFCLITTLFTAQEQRFVRVEERLLPSHAETTSDAGYESEDERQVRGGWTRTSTYTPPRHIFNLKRCSMAKLLTTPSKLFISGMCLPLKLYQSSSSVPLVLRDLFIADLASWVGIMSHSMFYTDFVATAVYGGQPDAPPGSLYDLLFDEGVRMGSWGLLLHSVTACIYAMFIQEKVTERFGLKRSYQIGLAFFALSMAVTVLNTSSITTLNMAAALSGVGYSVITTVPNHLVTMYHEDPVLYFGADAGKNGLGADLAILDSSYYLSQIWLSLVMGRLVELTGYTHYYIIVACISGVAATFAANKVVFTAKDIAP